MTFTFNKAFLIGCELVKRNYITQDQLDEGLIFQQRKNIRLGAALVELGYITEEDLAKVIADQLGIMYVDIKNYAISEDILNAVPKGILKSKNLIPIARSGEIVTVCVADPLDNDVHDILENALGQDVQLAIAGMKAIREAVEKYYRF